MKNLAQHRSCTLNLVSSAATAALAITVMFALAAVITQPAQAQTYSVIHYFQGSDGESPAAGVTIDQAGHLYGTTYGLFGTVFGMRTVDSYWVFSPLLSMPSGGAKGLRPQARVIKGPDGNLYGTTYEGGGSCSCGVVFKLQPPPTAPLSALTPWTETILHEFGGSDGSFPGYGDLVFDKAGNIYGTTEQGGAYGQGAVYELSPSNGGWTESVIYSFSGFSDGGAPYSGVIFDSAGNLYGTTSGGGQYSKGTVFELTPSNDGWIETVLHSFQPSEGTFPVGGLIFDPSGNLIGTTESGGLGGYDGSVFELSPSNGGWTFSVLHLFDFSKGEGVDPLAGMTIGSDGNLYGTTLGGGYYDDGTIFRLVYSGGYWTYQTLYSFENDGNSPFGGVTFDSQGNMYGTAIAGGQGACNGGCGVVWEITP